MGNFRGVKGLAVLKPVMAVPSPVKVEAPEESSVANLEATGPVLEAEPGVDAEPVAEAPTVEEKSSESVSVNEVPQDPEPIVEIGNGPEEETVSKPKPKKTKKKS